MQTSFCHETKNCIVIVMTLIKNEKPTVIYSLSHERTVNLRSKNIIYTNYECRNKKLKNCKYLPLKNVSVTIYYQ